MLCNSPGFSSGLFQFRSSNSILDALFIGRLKLFLLQILGLLSLLFFQLSCGR